MKRFMSLVICAIMTVSFLGSAALAEQKVLEAWWNADEAEQEYYSAIIDAFNQQNPDIKIVFRPYANEEYKTALQVAFGSDDPPDILFNWSGDDTGRLTREGHLLDLTHYKEQYGWAEQISPAALDAFSVNGKLYGAPYSQEVKYFYYNKGIFEQENLSIPQSFDELLGVCKTLKGKGIVPMSFGNSERWQACHYMSIFNQKMAGEDIIAADYTLTTPEEQLFTNQGYVEALEKLQEMQSAGCFQDGVNSTAPETAWAQFYTEQAAMTYGGTWVIGILKNGEFGNYGMFLMPPVEGAAGNQNYVLMGPIALEVSVKTPYPDEAAKFLDFFISKDSQLKMVDMRGRLPVRVDAVTEHSPWQVKAVTEDLSRAEGSVLWLDVILENRVSEAYLNGIQEVLGGTKTPQNVMKDVRAKALDVKKELGR